MRLSTLFWKILSRFQKAKTSSSIWGKLGSPTSLNIPHLLSKTPAP